MDISIKTKLARILARRSRDDQFSGVILVRQGEIDLFHRAYGYASRTWRVKNTPATRFRLASVGKLFTATAVMQLLEVGRLSLETRVVETLELQGTKIPPEATVYHLLTMTSGMADWINEESDQFEAEWTQFCQQNPVYRFRRNTDYLPIFSQAEPYGLVGEKFRYCGAGFILLGLLIEKLSGVPYEDYIRQNVFARAGMTRSGFFALDEVVPDVADGYVPALDENERACGWKKNIYMATAGPAADGGATATANDLARFSFALRTGRLFSPVLVREMLFPWVLEGNDARGNTWMHGLGCTLMLDGRGEVMRWGHPGEEEGVSCRLYHYTRKDLDVVILGNQSACAGKVGWDIHDLVMAL